jgi:hypothetical protein
MQNKPNFRKAKMNVNIYNIKDYQNFIPLAGYKNKPNLVRPALFAKELPDWSNPISELPKMNASVFGTKDYRKKDDFSVRINKPKTNPISVKPKMTANAFSQKDYENETAFRPQKNKPKQTRCRNNSRAPSCPGCLFINRMKRKQSQKDFPDFFEKLPVYGIDQQQQIT